MENFREPIFAALFAQVVNNIKLPYATKTRRFVPWGNASKANMPTLMQVDGITFEVTQLGAGALYGAQKYVLHAQIWAYAQANPSTNPENVPSQQANAMIDDIETSIQPIPGERQTLAAVNKGKPLVENAFVEGEGYCDPGIGQAGLILVMVPVKLITGV